ncbi:Sensory transduction protein regX3 (plasmid) [Tsukamurella tyrosinosolvens]|uniref:DNA-binding response regulator, OmpR family, contains REC and winged-helix (WHTH) domain n=1 Tax=Tsukamurella tyrosinosolvens TaxID=57704 RepID=A0A1H4Z6N8_TSUTY|nr:response regulator transcription factor [Tsukamurella tyrosinosolvens]AUN41639.1 DNA-binding response regulator [Tsukamurella tyrosinosolvens]KXO90834.1 two-component system response regulator [Tsukamurella tyrosinosolvens]QRY84407.1 response regulator transcription factor [Tsukamurella tyrosinosolvens]SED25010.1 DNA-binding response regulator, OmpR family, contains REC and winged-helix (wHTH) domain [Tsukamurella tyrosinosolvens]VEH91188.1 Sensory transduction protein regX3 [Tsukamurella t
MTTRVLLAEDDEAIASPLARALSREGYEVDVAGTGTEALRNALDGEYALLILDLGLPELDGLEVCREVRTARPELAVLMLTARTDEMDFVVGLDAGADDYVGKPFRMFELMARTRALLRRSAPVQDAPEVVEAAGIRLDATARRVTVDGADVALANKEFELLRFLMEHAGRLLSREEILADVWGDSDLRGSKTLDMHISWLRRKIGDDTGPQRRIVTVRGVGFRFDAE